MSIGHLSKRFFGSLSNAELSSEDTNWVRSNLLESEFELWQKMSVADRRHACGVARHVVALLDEKATRPVIAAALLHDIGKIDAQLNTLERVMATLVKAQAGPSQIESWSNEEGWLGRAGRYLNHHEIGAQMLAKAGSDPLTIAWTREHELVHTSWTLPSEITDALWKADNR